MQEIPLKRYRSGSIQDLEQANVKMATSDWKSYIQDPKARDSLQVIQEFINFGCNVALKEQQYYNIVSFKWFSKLRQAEIVGTIDQTLLLDENNELKTDLKQEIDYQVVPDKVWSACKTIFGVKGPDIRLKAVNCSFDPLVANIQLDYSIRLSIKDLNQDRLVPFRFPISSNGNVIIDIIKQTFKVKEFILWRNGCKQQPLELGNKTLYEKGLVSDCLLFLESQELIEQQLLNLQVGLDNLGNCCYMNSALQCLVHIEELTKYFISRSFEKDINYDNPLGTRGKIANSYAKLCTILKQTNSTSISPREFKSTIGIVNASFSGYLQQDSQEFLVFLIDALHEDLNRIKVKPYTERPTLNINNLEKTKELAIKSWELLKKRNDSIIIDYFTGLYKSTLLCPDCGQSSIIFDPFMDLILPLPVKKQWKHSVLFFPLDTATPLKIIDCTLDSTAELKDLTEYIKESQNVCNQIVVAEVFDHRVHRLLKREGYISSLISRNELIVIYEVESNKALLEVNSRDCNSLRMLAIPFFLNLEMKTVYSSSEIREMCAEKFKQMNSSTRNYSQDSFEMCLLSIDRGTNSFKQLVATKEDFIQYVKDLVDADFEPVRSLICDWKNPQDYFGNIEYFGLQRWPSAILLQKPDDLQKKLTIYDCLSEFLKQEKLGSNDPWYCPNCKSHKQACKSIDLWKTPKILILCLKRFSSVRDFRDKLDDYVDFPITGLNLSAFVASDTESNYDLIAVDNHYGGLGGGHYTAFAKCDDGLFYSFDDSKVTLIPNENVVSSAGYLLFYRKR